MGPGGGGAFLSAFQKIVVATVFELEVYETVCAYETYEGLKTLRTVSYGKTTV